MNNKKIITMFSLLCMLVVSVFADSVLGERYLVAANEQYSIGELEKAYNYINSSMKMYTDEPVPDAVLFSANLIYIEYLQQIKKNKDMASFDTVKAALIEFPLVVDDSITDLIKAINEIAIQEVEANQQKQTIDSSLTEKENSGQSLDVEVQKALFAQQLDALKAQHENELEEYQNSQKIASEKQEKLIATMSEQTGSLNEALTNSTLITEKNGKTITVILIVLGVIFLTIIGFIIFSLRNNKKQQDRFQATLEMVSRMNRTPNERLALGAVSDLYDGKLKSAGSSRWGVNALPESELTEKELNEINELAVKCERLGAEIDFITGRKNNSKNVSELVYKIACSMGMNPGKAKIYFCAAMVYDAGFLALDPDLLQSTTLNDEEKYAIRSHVQKGVEKLDFVPKKYQETFIDAATKHHENLDGSGYPEGLKGDEIPLIARIIRVVEMFTSLISRRNYRGIMDKDSALNELRAENESIDQQIVDLLDSLI